MTSSRPATSRPFTVLLCKECAAGPELAILDELRSTIRRCDHGVLLTTACMLGVLTCAPRTHGPGAMVMLQPCSIHRAPNGPAHWIGPINDPNEVRVVCDWVQQGGWDLRTLPKRLRAELRWTDRAVGDN